MSTFDDNRHGHAACTDGSGALPSKRAGAYWGGGSQARRRIEALQQSSASVALFLEYIPQNLHQWLGEQVDAGGEAADRACAMVERDLEAGTSFMNSRGLLHFDAHFENILTDGQRRFFADYGPAMPCTGTGRTTARRRCARTPRASDPGESRRRPRQSSPAMRRSPQ